MERCNEIRRPAQAAAMFHSSLSIPFPTTCMPLHTHICTCTHTQGGQPWRPVWEWYIHQWPPHAWFQPRFCPSRVPAEPWTQSSSQPGNENHEWDRWYFLSVVWSKSLPCALPPLLTSPPSPPPLSPLSSLTGADPHYTAWGEHPENWWASLSVNPTTNCRPASQGRDPPQHMSGVLLSQPSLHRHSQLHTYVLPSPSHGGRLCAQRHICCFWQALRETPCLQGELIKLTII